MIQGRKKRRVLFLFAHLHKGGMQRAVSNISLALPDDFEQYVGFFGTENPLFEYRATLHDFMIPGSLKIGFIFKIKNLLFRIYKLRRFVEKKGIDVVVSFGEAANVLNILSFNSAYRVLSVRSAIGGYGDTNMYDRLYSGMIRWMYPLSDAIVAVSSDLKEQIERKTRARVPVHHIPNLYQLSRISVLAEEPLSAELEYLTKSQFILNVGALIPEKGQSLLIEAFAKLSDIFPDIHLVMLGRGQKRDKYLIEAKKFGVSHRVTIVDFDPNPYKYMRRATIFALPSLTEGFPNVLVEAMACGCPVVAFDCPTGPREILKNSEYGELVESISAEALAERIHKLLASDERRNYLRDQGVRRAANYDANCVVNQWVDILSEHC